MTTITIFNLKIPSALAASYTTQVLLLYLTTAKAIEFDYFNVLLVADVSAIRIIIFYLPAAYEREEKNSYRILHVAAFGFHHRRCMKSP